MDRSRSPRNLSDEARFLQRLAEPELPPGASDAERAAARAEAAAGVEAAVDELGGSGPMRTKSCTQTGSRRLRTVRLATSARRS